MPYGSGRWGSFWEMRARQLQHRLRVKEERIVELELENAALHLQLAECRERSQRSGSEAWRTDSGRRGQPHMGSFWRLAASQLCCLAQKLKQDSEELRASSMALLRGYQAECRHCVSEVVVAAQEALRVWQSQAACLEQSLSEVSARYELEKQRRKSLHNSLVDLKGGIRVQCRIRPLLPLDGEPEDTVSQDSPDSREVARAVDSETVVVQCCRPGHPPINKTYTFERVYGPAETQSKIFGEVQPLLTSLLDGYNVCIMAYGQTGSGKSYTMLGSQHGDEPAVPTDADSDCGLVPRVAWELFRLLSEETAESRQVEVSAVEVYNNNVFDLLAEGGSAQGPRVKREVTTIQEGRPEVPLLTCQAVGSATELLACVRQGLKLRAQQPTLVHASSSRSHLIITVTLPEAPSSCSGPRSEMNQSSPAPGQPGSLLLPQKRAGPSPPWLVPKDDAHHGQQEHVRPKLQLVDLAGSECVGDSGVTGLSLWEASSINRSLAALADVLGALSQRRAHVPYRNSKLTHLLQDSIGGDAKLLVLLCVSPGRKHVAETLQSLAFGARARQVKRGPARRKAPRVPVRKEPCAGGCAMEPYFPS
ncbi:kinesin-like protein KIF25 [Ochotona princeps]|uniref:kinesin-like protein KIF25 n=1 Tax=Ochotona princeps TaxID=9978 RepID=UPI002714BBAE|nr:kinesin-like protein KIF25 [Ochotona princeps]